MATVEPHYRRGPDIRARISTRDEPEDYLKAQLECASRAQQAWRSRTSWHPHLARQDIANNLHRVQVALLKKAGRPRSRSRPSPHDYVQDHAHSDLDRTFSFNSLSTLQREADAADLSQWRDSPISAISRPGRSLPWDGDRKIELEDPCPPLRVVTIKEQRKEEKLMRKSIKEKEKKLKRTRREAAQLRRDALASNVAGERFRSKQEELLALEAALPTLKIPSSSKEKAVKLVKKFTQKRHGHRSSSCGVADGGHVDSTSQETSSSLEARDSISPIPVRPGVVAELPANLPPYTPFEDSTRTADNELPLEVKEPPQAINLEEQTRANVSQLLPTRVPSRTMRCDSCRFGIKLDEIYYHCCVCDDGDRILCRACEAAGESCRHDLTEKVRKVLRYGVAARPSPDSESEGRPPSLAETQGSPPKLTAVQMTSGSTGEMADRKRADSTAMEDQLASKFRELEIKAREQHVIAREKEAALRERETALREEMAILRERETLAIDRNNMLTQQVQLSLAQQKLDLATCVGAQFESLKKELSESVKTACQPSVSPVLERSLSQGTNTDSITLESPQSPIVLGGQTYYPAAGISQPLDLTHLDESKIRNHGAKRKAGGRSDSAPSAPSNRASKQPLRSLSCQEQNNHDDEEEDSGSGTPKKIKQDPDAAAGPEKLFACHFCKFDRNRYSEHNVTEKHYRGCSSGYWPDISRLKQHLYRVHWRRIHCSRCFENFDSKAELDGHARRAVACLVRDCPYEEKFSDVQHNEIRKKRPASTPEEVWYTIYSILFPQATPPATPYAEPVTGGTSVAPSPILPTGQETWEALEDIFEGRLNMHQGQPGQAWLRSPGAREFIRAQLRESMADVIQRLTPANSPYSGIGSTDMSPQTFLAPSSARRSSVAQTPSSSIPPSPAPVSATSTRSGSSAQWPLPNHRRSFSRPFPARCQQQSSTTSHDQSSSKANLSDSEDIIMTGVTFPLPNPKDAETDTYDGDCGSWQHGDELGLAITTDDLKFNLVDHKAQLVVDTTSLPAHRGPSPPPISTAFTFKPVKLASVADVPDGEPARASILKQNRSNASIDSGYGSLGSRPSTAGPGRQGLAEDSKPVPESELNLEALDVSFEDFLGAEMDELGNVGGKSLTEYLDGRYPHRALEREDVVA